MSVDVFGRAEVREATSERKGRGGKRDGAGRPPKIKGRPMVVRERRPEVTSSTPVHVTLRLRRDVGSLRRKTIFGVVRSAIRELRVELGMFVAHFSVQHDHIHMIVEATSTQALSRGMAGLIIRMAKRLNSHLSRTGKVMSDRFHARVLTSYLEVRRALLYVLNNARKHAFKVGVRMPVMWLDPYSSAAWFDRWSVRPVIGDPNDSPVRESKEELLRTGGFMCGGTLFPGAIPSVPRYLWF